MRPFSIREQVLFVALTPVAATVLALMLYFTLLRYKDIEESLVKRGATMARQLAPAAEYGMFSGNTIELDRLALSVAREPDVSAIAFFDKHGKLLAATGALRSATPSNQLPDNWMEHSNDGRTLLFHTKVIQTSRTIFDDPFLQPDSAAHSANRTILGSLTLELSREQLLAHKREILLFTLLSASLILAGAILLAIRLGRDITIPVQALEDAVARISQGEMAVQIPPHKGKVLHALGDGVNAMARALDAAKINADQALASSQAKLSEQHEFANALIQAQADAGVCMMLIEDCRVVYVNDAAVINSGYSREDYLALTDLQPFLSSHIEISRGDGLSQPINNADSTRRFIARFLCKNGEWRFFDVATAKLTNVTPLRTIIIALDITQRKQDGRRLASANIELRRQKEEAERANQAKSRFLAAASHDLRQPLHALSLFAGEIKDHATSSEQLRLAQQIKAATASLAQLLDALLDISRSDIAETKAHHQALPLMPLLETVAEAHRHSAREKGLKLSVRPTNLWIESDPQLLNRIISNLTANAVRYTYKGGVLLGVRCQGKQLRIEVWDTGIGIEPEHQPNLFDEFFQVDNPERDASKGLGLGLSIVARLAQALGHPVEVRSWPRRGSCFSVTVPRSSPLQKPLAVHPLVTPTQLNARILLIDEDTEMREHLAYLLNGWGCQVTQSSGARDIPPSLLADQEIIITTFNGLDHLKHHDMASRPRLVLLGDHTENKTTMPYIAGQLHYPPRPAQLRALLQHLSATASIN